MSYLQFPTKKIVNKRTESFMTKSQMHSEVKSQALEKSSNVSVSSSNFLIPIPRNRSKSKESKRTMPQITVDEMLFTSPGTGIRQEYNRRDYLNSNSSKSMMSGQTVTSDDYGEIHICFQCIKKLIVPLFLFLDVVIEVEQTLPSPIMPKPVEF